MQALPVLAWLSLEACSTSMKVGPRASIEIPEAEAAKTDADEIKPDRIEGGGVGVDLSIVRDGGSDSVMDASDTVAVADVAGKEASPEAESPQDIPSHQKVIFKVRNSGSDVRYLASSGDTGMGPPARCSPYGISKASGVRLSLVFPRFCGCECPAPPPPGLTELLPIPSGQTRELIWDARAVVTRPRSVMCQMPGGPSTMVSADDGDWQPVAPGSSQATLITKSALPKSCRPGADAQGNDIVTCWPPFSITPDFGGLCDISDLVTASFELPATGDVIVPVTL